MTSEDKRDALHHKLQLRQQEAAAKREEVARLRRERIRADANGEVRAERLHDQYERATQDLRRKEEAIQLLQREVEVADREYADWLKKVEEADVQAKDVYGAFSDQLAAFTDALREFVQQHDPLAVQIAMREATQAETRAALRTTGRPPIGRPAVEGLFRGQSLLFETTTALAQYQAVNGYGEHHQR